MPYLNICFKGGPIMLALIMKLFTKSDPPDEPWFDGVSLDPHTYRSFDPLCIVGNRYLIRSNEPEPIAIAEFSHYHQFPNFVMPVYKEVDTGKEFCSGGIIVEYNHVLYLLLTKLPALEQWNYLAHNHTQISEKYGIEYKTHPCKCKACAASS
jgi:hypothetical protein